MIATEIKRQKTTQTPHQMKILVVEDNEDLARVLERAITQFLRHRVALAFDGAQALEKAATFRPDLILLDIGLPKLDGYAVAERIRKTPELRKVVMVAVTAYGSPQDQERAYAAGIDRHVTKPIGFQDLRDIIDTAGKEE